MHLDLLLGEHVFAVAKLADAAAAGREDEFHAYAAMLAGNGGDLEALFRAALGETSGGQLGSAWTEQNNDLVDYIVAAATHDQAAADAAMAKLTGQYVAHAATVLSSGVGLSAETASKAAAGHANAMKSVIDDAAAANYKQLYADIASARIEAVTFGDAIALQVARQFADRFPGDPLSSAATLRTNFNSLMQQRAYLMTMASDAAVNGSTDELSALTTMLATASDMPPPPDVWTQEATLIVAYARSGDPAVGQNVLKRAAAPLDLNDAMTAVLKVVDDQRNKHFANLALDDRAMASQFALAADGLSLNGG